MLGIVIGIAAVIAMISLGNGAQQSVRDRIAKLGTTTLQIDATWVRSGGVQTNVRKRVTIDDVRSIDERAIHVLGVMPQQDKDLQVQWGNRNANVKIVGATANFPLIQHFTIDRGRMFTPGEDIGWQLFIPFGTGRYRLFKTDRLDDIFALATSEADLTDAMNEVTIALRRSHHLTSDQENDFRIRNQADLLATLGETTQVFTSLLAGIAAVSLLVGGIGIMNIMLVSVTERTREIGIRKALGATRRNILLQFLIEAVTLCVLGGFVGVGVGVSGAVLLRNSFGWSTAINSGAVVLAFAFAAAVGLLFGVWPARRAARLDPIEALRFE